MRSPSDAFDENATERAPGSGQLDAELEARNLRGPSRMRRNRATGMLLAAALVAAVVAADILFFRGGRWSWERLAALLRARLLRTVDGLLVALRVRGGRVRDLRLARSTRCPEASERPRRGSKDARSIGRPAPLGNGGEVAFEFAVKACSALIGDHAEVNPV